VGRSTAEQSPVRIAILLLHSLWGLAIKQEYPTGIMQLKSHPFISD
jgi:hypothetical protein